MANQSDVWVVVPNWNGADVIAECLNSLEAQSQKHQVVVVDNGSIDRSIELIEEKFRKVRLIKLPKNRGFAGGVNAGIKYALEKNADAVALFNNDAVADKDWLKNLAEVLETNKQAGIVTGKFMRADRKHFDSTGENYSIWGMPFPRGRNQKDTGQFDKQQSVFGASGGASLYRVKMFQEIGLFDEKFFAYFEDVDISFRAQLAGWKVIYEPGAVAYHHVGATTSKLGSFTRYHSIKNFFMLYTKNTPGNLYWKYMPLLVLQALRLLVSSMLKGGLFAYSKALARFILYLPAVLNERRKIQKSRKVSAKSIDALLYHHRPPTIPSI